MKFENSNTDASEMNEKRITLKDISNKVGVSIGTVDRALNNRGRISEKTKKRILEAARELNYQRNEFARALRKRGEIRIVAIYPQDLFNYNEYFTAGFSKEASKLSDYGVKLDIIRTKSLDSGDILHVVNQIDISIYDGVLLNAGGPELNGFINHTIALGIPVVTFNSDAPMSNRTFFYGENHYNAGQLSGELVAKLLRGKGTVAFFSGISSVYALQQRLSGFQNSIRSYPGIICGQNISNDDTTIGIIEKANELLFSKELPDAVFCNSASGVLPICKVIKAHHLPVPPVVVGYDYSKEVGEMLKEGICTAIIFQNPERQASHALSYLFRFIYSSHSPSAVDTASITPTIILRSNMNICEL